MSENWLYHENDIKRHQEALKFFEKHKEELQKRPVKRVPMGFSYEREKMKKKSNKLINK
ncbi:hypothetical protein [Capnocytophaga felis]|uniref:hypothetical protein n=1 Tax=Capnocytophaga felis TaxID=2267611 RepID=UPI0012D2BEA9|nr:hypothetical protein [Capnocytophaga felis]